MTTTVPAKRCTKCHRDLNGEKRFKDGKGQYWCADCGVPDAPGVGSGMMTPCPKCHAPTHATHFVRNDGAYVCETCASGVKSKGNPAGAAGVNDEQAAQRKKLILAVCLIAIGISSYLVLNYYVL